MFVGMRKSLGHGFSVGAGTRLDGRKHGLLWWILVGWWWVIVKHAFVAAGMMCAAVFLAPFVAAGHMIAKHMDKRKAVDKTA